jgi:hypothetical protein
VLPRGLCCAGCCLVHGLLARAIGNQGIGNHAQGVDLLSGFVGSKNIKRQNTKTSYTIKIEIGQSGAQSSYLCRSEKGSDHFDSYVRNLISLNLLEMFPYRSHDHKATGLPLRQDSPSKGRCT